MYFGRVLEPVQLGSLNPSPFPRCDLLKIPLEHIQAFPIPGGDSQIAQTVPVLFSLGMEGDHGAGLQPGFA